MSRLATIPHAPIERVKHETGEVEHLQPGSLVNVEAASGIFARVHDDTRSAVVVQLPAYDWLFVVDNDDQAVEWARKLNHLALR